MPAIFVLIDGLRPDVLEIGESALGHMPHLSALRNRSAYTMSASSVMPSVTLPCHMSIFHSVPPTRHGVVTNDYQPMARPVRGLVDVAKANNLRCSFIYNWEPLRNLSQPGALYFSHMIDNCDSDINSDMDLTYQALNHIHDHSPDFVFLYLCTVDAAGHKYGWMSDGYLEQVVRVDKAVGVLLADLPANYVTLVHADHGGHDRTHGTECPENMTIPWLIAGPGIRENYSIQHQVTLLDTAPTLARVLGIPIDSNWEGHPVDEAFIETTIP